MGLVPHGGDIVAVTLPFQIHLSGAVLLSALNYCSYCGCPHTVPAMEQSGRGLEWYKQTLFSLKNQPVWTVAELEREMTDALLCVQSANLLDREHISLVEEIESWPSTEPANVEEQQ